MQDIFSKRKKDILSKQDKSFMQVWDKKIAGLCEKINKKENYYTTSSCSGRIILIIESDKKEHGLFVKVYHDLISFKKFMDDLRSLTTRDISCLVPDIRQGTSLKNRVINNKFKQRNLTESILKQLYSEQKRSEISFKQEPCGIHIACRTLKDSQKFLDKAKFAGWKKSGIIASNKRFIVECFSTEKLEFPIISKGKILVDDNFLRLIVKKSNENLRRSWRAISRLEKEIENIEIKKDVK